MNGTTAYVLSRKYVNDTAISLGSLKGAPCTVDKIEEFDDYIIITLGWEGTDGTKNTRQFTIHNGVSVNDLKIKDRHLFVYLTDGKEIDAGEISGTGVASGIWIGDNEPPKDKGYVLWISPKEDDPTSPDAIEIAVGKYIEDKPKAIEDAVDEYLKENPPEPSAIDDDAIHALFNF